MHIPARSVAHRSRIYSVTNPFFFLFPRGPSKFTTVEPRWGRNDNSHLQQTLFLGSYFSLHNTHHCARLVWIRSTGFALTCFHCLALVLSLNMLHLPCHVFFHAALPFPLPRRSHARDKEKDAVENAYISKLVCSPKRSSTLKGVACS